jgi:hypothetical protein
LLYAKTTSAAWFLRGVHDFNNLCVRVSLFVGGWVVVDTLHLQVKNVHMYTHTCKSSPPMPSPEWHRVLDLLLMRGDGISYWKPSGAWAKASTVPCEREAADSSSLGQSGRPHVWDRLGSICTEYICMRSDQMVASPAWVVWGTVS